MDIRFQIRLSSCWLPQIEFTLQPERTNGVDFNCQSDSKYWSKPEGNFNHHTTIEIQTMNTVHSVCAHTKTIHDVEEEEEECKRCETLKSTVKQREKWKS